MKINRGRNYILAGLVSLAVAAMAVPIVFVARADKDDGTRYSARLLGFGEVPPKNADGKGTFTGTLSPDGTSLTWKLTYTGLTGAPLFAHIHFGQPQNTGAVVVFFCGGGGRPACPDGPNHSGTVTGTWTAADIVSVPAQDVTGMDFAGFIKILNGHLGYANVHTPLFTAGEIRGQVSVSDDDDR
jgi:hypothetical protein